MTTPKTQAPTNGKTTEKTTAVNPSLQIVPVKNAKPLEDRILRVQELSDLVSKHGKLEDSLKKLNSINASTDNRGLKITIEDDNEEWETFNTEAIQDCIKTMQSTIKRKLEETAAKISF